MCLIRMLRAIQGLEEIAMTTNGVYLKDIASSLKTAGLDRINISMDSLNRDKYASITGEDCFENAWEGMMEALKVGIDPVKLNVVVMLSLMVG